MNTHLHILHLPYVPIKKVNDYREERLRKLLIELENQNMKDYTIVEGFYDESNTKEAIHKGHRLIVELAKKQGLENCIIAEDDIIFSSPNSYNYFLSCMPDSYDMFFGLIYQGSLDENNKVLNGMSGVMTLYSIHNKFYDYFLSLDINTHIDRELGQSAFNHEYFVCPKQVVTQRGGYSFNLRREMYYDAYMENKDMYKG